MANTIYNASLVMTADISQAKQQLQSLQNSINNLLKTSHNSSPLGLTTEINQALSKVADLKVALDSAMNINTGKLDLTKFNASLKESNTSIIDYAKTLQSLGPAGQQAFSQLAQSIMSAEVPLRKTNQLLKDFKTTLTNTVKWQISSSIVHSLAGAMQHAYGYAQDLNRSLNDIRIVTGYNTEQMAKFAEEANRAAKSLSTTTTQYTDAALIFYQQGGMSDAEIKARTDATIKMANVTGESARSVSDYMTAIWNNFDNGSKTLEYYADVMTALGAATASSTDEIAAGLEKFAAASNTVGLSYEYATAALATVTAETRQSADVVGNAFKTLFSRIQGLNLGETQDDGTTLNKYSQALENVGISIKDTSGNIKSMDTILDELGSKWNTLSQDTQLALAQAVAGVRQYTQLIALMDNWDTFKVNLNVAEGSEGTLQKQADIYAESWEAASDRVETSMQDIYDSILNDKFFIKLTNFFGDLTNVIGNTIDGIGGMSGAFAALGMIISRVWGKDIAKGFQSLTYNPKNDQAKAEKLRQDTNAELKKVYGQDASLTGKARYQAYSAQSNVQNSILEAQTRLEQKGTTLTDIEKTKAAILSQQTIELGKQLISITEMAEEEERKVEAQQKLDKNNYRRNYSVDKETEDWYDENIEAFRENSKEIGLGEFIYRDLSQASQAIGDDIDSFNALKISVSKFNEELDESEGKALELHKKLNMLSNAESKQDFDNLLDGLEKDINKLNIAADELYSNLRTIDVTEDQLNREYQTQMSRGALVGERVKAKNALNAHEKSSIDDLNKFDGQLPSMTDGFIALTDAISSCAFAMNALMGLYNIWNNEDMSFTEKLVATFTTLATVLPSVVMAFKSQNLAQISVFTSSVSSALGLKKVAAAATTAGTTLQAGAVSAGTFATSLLAVLGPIALVVAAIAGIAGAIYLANKAYNSHTEALKDAKENLDQVTNAVESNRQAHVDLLNTLEGYQKNIETLKELAYGTTEWKNTVADTNSQVLELLDNFSDLKNYTTNDNGRLIISEEGQKYLENEIANRNISLQNAELLAKMRVNSAEAYVKSVEEKRNQGYEEDTTTYSFGNGREFVLTKENREDLLEDYADKDINNLNAASLLQFLEDYGYTTDNMNFVGADLSYAEDEITTDLESLLESIKNSEETFYDLVASTEKVIEVNDIYGGQIADNYLKDNKTYNQSNNKDIIRNIMASTASDYEAIKLAAQKEMDRTDRSSDEEYHRAYAKAMGYEFVEDTDTGAKFRSANGGDPFELQDSTIFEQWALDQAMQKALDALSQLENSFNKWQTSGDGKGKALYSIAATGDATKQLTLEELETLQQGPKTTDQNAFIDEYFGGNVALFEQVYESLGHNSADEFFIAFNEQIESKEIWDKLTDGDGKVLEKYRKLGTEAVDSLKSAYEKIELGPAGADGADEFLDAFTKVINESELDNNTINALAQIDWSKEGSLEEGKQLLEDMGYDAKEFDEYLQALAIHAYQLDFSKFTTLKEDLESIVGIVSDLDLGSILSEEDYQLLSKYVDELENYFMLTSQGRKFIGTDEDANMIGEEAYKAGLAKLQQQQKAQVEVSNYGHDVNGVRVSANWSRYGTNGDWEEANLNRIQTLYNILNHENAETLEAIGAGYSDWAGKSLDELTNSLSDEQIGQFFDALAAMTSNPIDESTIHRYNQTILGDSKNINEFEDNLNMVGAENTGLTPEQIEDQRQYFQDLTNDLAKEAESFKDLEELLSSKEINKEAYDIGYAAVQEKADQMAMDTTSYKELNDLLAEGTINQQAFQKGLVAQAKQYPILASEIEAYNEALASKDPEKAKKAYENLTKSFKVAQITKYAKSLKEAIKTIKDLKDTQIEGIEGNEEYNSAISTMAETFSEAFGFEVDPTTIESNFDKFNEFIETGSGELYNELSVISAQSSEKINEIASRFGIAAEDLMSNISSIDGSSFTISGFADFSQLINDAHLSYDQAAKLATLISSLSKSGVSFDIQGLNSIAKYLDAIKTGDYTGALEALTELDKLSFEGSGDFPEGFQGGLESGSYVGGGSGEGDKEDKLERKELTDSLMETYEKKRERIQAQYEGLDPESASKYIKQEIKLLEEEQEILEKQIKTWKNLLKAKIQEFNAEYADELGFDLNLNDNGEIANLSEVYQQLIQMYDEGNTDIAEDIYNKLKESEELQYSIDEAVQTIADKEREQAEKTLKDITERIDWRIKKIDYQIERLNYYQEKLLIQAHGNKQTIEAMLEGFQYQEQEMLQLFEKGAALRQGIDELNAAKQQFPNNTQIFDEQILEYQSDLIDLNLDILNLRADMEELVQNVLDLALEEIDTQNQRIDRYVTMLDKFQNIIDLSGRSILDQALKVEIGTTKIDTLIRKMGISKQTMEGLADATAKAQQALENRKADGDETSVSFWENQVEQLEMELEKAQVDFLNNWEAVLQAAADLFDMRVELTVQTLEQALSPFSDLDILEDRYNKAKTIQDQYLSDATKLYELNKLNRELNMSIQDEADLLSRSKLRDIQEEILALQKAGVQMSQYDLDVLQKKYDLRLAEIALMEAQNSKTSMRLIRDAAGNWTYAYDADQQSIEDATQRYEDAIYELDQLAIKYIGDVSEQLIAMQQEYAEALGSIDRNAADYQQQLIDLQEHYMERYGYLLGELKKGTSEAGVALHDTLYGNMMDLFDFEDAYNRFSTNSNDTIAELMINYKDWQKVVEQTMEVAGTSWENFSDDTGATLDSLQEHIAALCDEISKLVDVLMQYVATAIGMVEEWQAKYSKRVDQEIAMNEAYIDGNFMSSGGGGLGFDPDLDYSRYISYLMADQGLPYDHPKVQQAITERGLKMQHEGYTQYQSTADVLNEGWKNYDYNNPNANVTSQTIYNVSQDTNQYFYTDDKGTIKPELAQEYQRYDTGGYTGEWGPDGKLALLDEKELVLNKKDTKNILSAVKIARTIDDLVGGMFIGGSARLHGLTGGVPVAEKQNIEQTVQISAEFPGVVDQYEIQAALSNLSNDASQYLNIRRNLL